MGDTAGIEGPVVVVALPGEVAAGRAVADDKDGHGAVVPLGGLLATGSGGIGTTRVSDGDVGDAHVVTHGKGRAHLGLSLAVEHAEHAADQTSVDSADHWMLDGGPAERAVFGHDPQSSVAVGLGSGREAVGGEGVGVGV